MGLSGKILERSVLACFIKEPSLIDKYNKVSSEWFSDGLHKTVYSALNKMWKDNTPIDIATAKVATDSYLIDEIIESDHVIGHIQRYYDLLESNFLDRRMIKLLDTMAGDLRGDGEMSGKSAVDQMLSKFMDLSTNHINSDTLEKISDAGVRAMANIKRAKEGGPLPYLTTTDIHSFNKLFPGGEAGDMITLASRPSHGKTAFAMQMAIHNARQGKKVGFISLEMPSEALFVRLLAFENDISMNRIKSGEITEYEYGKLTKTWKEFKDIPLYIDNPSSMSELELRSVIRRMKRIYDIDFVVIDYIQLMSYSGRADSRQVEVSKISRSIKQTALELSVPIIALSQLNRDVELHKPYRPTLAHLRESGAIEQDSDVVLFLYKPWKYPDITEYPDGMSVDGTSEIIVAKYRNGETGYVRVADLAQQMKLADLDFGSVNRRPAEENSAF